MFESHLAQFGFDGQFTYFAIHLYGGGTHSEDGSVDLERFGSGTRYEVRLSENANDGLLLRVDGSTKEVWSPSLSAGEFESKSTEGFWDANGDVGGTAITTPAEGTDGFETQPVLSDGKLEADDTKIVLYSRISFADVDGNDFPDSGETPFVELAFDYNTYNQHVTDPDQEILPGNLQYLVFAANRGTKDPANYLWNDEYTASEAGSPYQEIDLQNVYELDTLTAGLPTIPGPPALLLVVVGLGTFAWLKRRLA